MDQMNGTEFEVVYSEVDPLADYCEGDLKFVYSVIFVWYSLLWIQNIPFISYYSVR